MATTKDFHDYVLECLQQAGEVSTRKMMGEYCVYYMGKVIGLICDNTLYLKATPSSEKLLENSEKGYPYEGSKTLMHIVDDFENIELMREVINVIYNELPDNKKK